MVLAYKRMEQEIEVADENFHVLLLFKWYSEISRISKECEAPYNLIYFIYCYYLHHHHYIYDYYYLPQLLDSISAQFH